MAIERFTRADYTHAQEFAVGRSFSLRTEGEPQHSALAELIAETRERDAGICDEVAKSESRTPSEKAVARMLAKRIREGRP